jgi:autotransporter-associated beta strand protein
MLGKEQMKTSVKKFVETPRQSCTLLLLACGLPLIVRRVGRLLAGVAASFWLLLGGSPALASTATWTNLAGGSWANAGNWLNGVVGNGSDSTNHFDTLTLTGDTTVTLDSWPTVGTLFFGDLGGLYSWNVNAGSPAGTLTLAAATKPVINVSNQTATIAAPVAGANGVVKAGPGTLVLSGNLTYSGATIINDGTLQLTSGDFATPKNPNTSYTINAGGGLVAGNGGLGCIWDTKITNNAGILQMACASGHDAVRELTMNGGTVTMAAGYENNVLRMYQGDLWTLDGLNTITPIFNMINFGGGQVTLNVIGGTTTLSGTLNDWPGLGGAQVIKNGAGTLDLTGANTYTGATVVNNGTLRVNGSLAAGSAVTVGSAGTLGGTGTIGGAATVQAGGTLSPGASSAR